MRNTTVYGSLGLRSWVSVCVSDFGNSKLVFGSGTKLRIESSKLFYLFVRYDTSHNSLNSTFSPRFTPQADYI